MQATTILACYCTNPSSVIMDTIIQWNCRGFRANYDEISLLLQKFNPVAVCLQETFLKTDDKFTLKNYSMYHSFSPNPDRASGGVCIIVNNSVPQSSVTINSNIQAVAVRVTLHKPITLCSINIPPSSNLNLRELNDLYEQLPSPVILLGDLNGHNILWGCSDTNERGRKIEDFISDQNLCIVNDKLSTYLHGTCQQAISLD